jgi:DNA-binding IclR family transcriptional regulator
MKSVRNAIRALELFSEQRPEISVSLVSGHLKIPKSSASRMLAAMRDGGLIEQEPRGRLYRPAALAHRLGSLYAAKTSSREIVRAAMVRLAQETRHSCWMSALSGADIVILEGIHGGYPIRLVVEAGSRLPGHATAAGKALLSRLDDDQIKALYPGGRLQRLTDVTLRNLKQLLSEIAEIRKRRWAETRQEMIDGIKSIGISLWPKGEGSPIALSVSFPVNNVSADGERAVLSSLLRIGRDVGIRVNDATWQREL